MLAREMNARPSRAAPIIPAKASFTGSAVNIGAIASGATIKIAPQTLNSKIASPRASRRKTSVGIANPLQIVRRANDRVNALS
jgi:hypothetical protein